MRTWILELSDGRKLTIECTLPDMDRLIDLIGDEAISHVEEV